MDLNAAIVIIACVVAIVSAIVAVLSYVSTRTYARRVRRPITFAPWQMEGESSSVRIFPQNIGVEAATAFHVMARFPSDAKIESLRPGTFSVEKGGIGSSYAVLVAARVHPGTSLEPVLIVAKQMGKEVPPAEVISWCQEDTAFINIPPIPD